MHLAAVLLQKIIRGRREQITIHEGRQRRQALLDELRQSDKVNPDQDEYTRPDLKLSPEESFEQQIQSEYVAKQLDFITKELTRLGEARRIDAMVKLAHRTKQIRETEESGKKT
jgi:hypothetical protein